MVVYDRGHCGRSFIFMSSGSSGNNWRFTGGDPGVVASTLNEPSCKSCQCNNPQVTDIVPSVASYPSTPDGDVQPLAAQVSVTQWVANMGSTAQELDVTFTFTSTTTSTITTELTDTVTAKLEIGLPKLIPATGKMEFSGSKSWKDSKTQTGTVSQQITITTKQVVPAFTNQSVTATSSLGQIQCTVSRQSHRVHGLGKRFLAALLSR